MRNLYQLPYVHFIKDVDIITKVIYLMLLENYDQAFIENESYYNSITIQGVSKELKNFKKVSDGTYQYSSTYVITAEELKAINKYLKQHQNLYLHQILPYNRIAIILFSSFNLYRYYSLEEYLVECYDKLFSYFDIKKDSLLDEIRQLDPIILYVMQIILFIKDTTHDKYDKRLLC